MMLQFGCHNHKFDNALKPAPGAFAAVWAELPEAERPILLPNMYQKSRVEEGKAVEGRVMSGGHDAAYLISTLLAGVDVKNGHTTQRGASTRRSAASRCCPSLCVARRASMRT
jgi:hypothetical protein